MKKLGMKTNHLFILSLVCLFFSCESNSNNTLILPSQKEISEFTKKVNEHYIAIDINDFSDGFNHARYIYPNSIPPWELYDTTQILGFAENMIYLQNPDGGWAKNLDFQRKYSLAELIQIQNNNKDIPAVTYEKMETTNGSTIDNRNIFSQIKYLVQVYAQVNDSRYLDCALKALQWILNAQHPLSGGFTGADVFAITYNDDVMSDTLRTLRDVARNDLYCVFPQEIRQKAELAYQKGLKCILSTQITISLSDDTKILTAWCQQHDHDSLKPIWAREFEPPSICTLESAKLVEFLMEENNPSQEIKSAIKAACEWFNRDDVRIHGKKIVKLPAAIEVLGGRSYDYEQVMKDDEGAADIWARFYALDSTFDVVSGARKPIQGIYPPVNTPVWCDRGCKYVSSFNEISKERRNGYGYTTSKPDSTLKKYEIWKTKYE